MVKRTRYSRELAARPSCSPNARQPLKKLQYLKDWGLDALTRLNLMNSKNLRIMRGLWESYDPRKPEGAYRQAATAVRFLTCDAKDIEKFSLMLRMFNQDSKFRWKAGFFLSALINYSGDENFVVHTKALHTRIDFLGFRNTKNILVNGSVGSKLGCSMKKGLMHINGDAKTWVGDGMKGGHVIIEGSVVSDVGIYMKGGAITVKGNVGSRVGCHMSGGRIDVEGSAQDVGLGMSGGTISVDTHADLIGQDMKGGRINLEGTYGKIGEVVLGEISYKGKAMTEVSLKEKMWYWVKQYAMTFKELVVSPRFAMRYIGTLSLSLLSYPVRAFRRKLQIAGDYARFKLNREGKLDEME
jgi:hypothetical protein